MNKVKMLENKQIEVQMEAILDSKKGQRYFIFTHYFYCHHFYFYLLQKQLQNREPVVARSSCQNPNS